MTIVEAAAAVTTVAGAIAVVYVTTKKTALPLVAWFRKLNRAIAELSPNGGSSIKDAINRIDTRGEVTSARTLAIQDTSPIPVYECDPNGSNRYVNHALCELFGLDAAEMRGNGWLEGIEPEDRQSAFEVWHQAVVNNVPYEHEYVVVNQRTGERIKCRTIARAMRNGKGEIIGFHGTVERV